MLVAPSSACHSTPPGGRRTRPRERVAAGIGRRAAHCARQDLILPLKELRCQYLAAGRVEDVQAVQQRLATAWQQLAADEPDEPEHLRRLAQKVRLDAHPNIESAIAIAGSTAQGKVQLFPGDTDFFERINIKSASEHDARETLRDSWSGETTVCRIFSCLRTEPRRSLTVL